MIIVGSCSEWPRYEARDCRRCGRITWVDPILRDYVRLHRQEAEIVCERCYGRAATDAVSGRLTRTPMRDT
jgi:hypothetical protein